MSRVQFLRAEPFVAGDLIVHLFVDGRKCGSLIGGKPVELQLEPGTYTVQAQMFGHKGETVVVHVADEDQTVSVSGTRIGMQTSLTGTMVYLALIGVPNKPLWLYALSLTLLIASCAFDMYRWRKIRPQLLRLSVSDGIAASVPAKVKSR